MAAKRRIQTYAFIDTNIFLDFYRGKNEASLSLLEKLEQVKDRIICTYQVEMEFLKNRQEQIKKILSDTKFSVDAQLPAALADTKLNKAVGTMKKNTDKANKRLKKHILSLLQNRQKDRVFTVVDSIFNSGTKHVLTREMPIRHAIKRRAWRRFILGYPPRKDKATSTGDAINWEWIIYCATELELRGRYYIVSRDGDYGCEHDGTYLLNDHLMREFRERVGNKSLVYTHKLSEALEALDVPVTKEEKQAEQQDSHLLDLSLAENDSLSFVDLSAKGYSDEQIHKMIRDYIAKLIGDTRDKIAAIADKAPPSSTAAES